MPLFEKNGSALQMCIRDSFKTAHIIVVAVFLGKQAHDINFPFIGIDKEELG